MNNKEEYVDLGHNCVCEKKTYERFKKEYNKNPRKWNEIVTNAFDNIFKEKSTKTMKGRNK